MSDNPQDKAQIIQMNSVTNSSPVTGQIWFDGTNLRMNIGGTSYYLSHTPAIGSQYTVANTTANRSLNGSASTIGTLTNIVGTLLQDLQAANL